MPFTYISIITIYHCTLSQITPSCKNDAQNLEQNKYLPIAPHFCVQLFHRTFWVSLFKKDGTEISFNSETLGKQESTNHWKNKRLYNRKKPTEDLWWKVAGPPELLLATKREKNVSVSPWETKHQSRLRCLNYWCHWSRKKP